MDLFESNQVGLPSAFFEKNAEERRNVSLEDTLLWLPSFVRLPLLESKPEANMTSTSVVSAFHGQRKPRQYVSSCDSSVEWKINTARAEMTMFSASEIQFFVLEVAERLL